MLNPMKDIHPNMGTISCDGEKNEQKNFTSSSLTP